MKMDVGICEKELATNATACAACFRHHYLHGDFSTAAVGRTMLTESCPRSRLSSSSSNWMALALVCKFNTYITAHTFFTYVHIINRVLLWLINFLLLNGGRDSSFDDSHGGRTERGSEGCFQSVADRWNDFMVRINTSFARIWFVLKVIRRYIFCTIS